MSSAIIMNLAAVAVIVAGWTAAVVAFYTRLDGSRTLPRAARNHELTENRGAGPRPQPALAGNLGA